MLGNAVALPMLILVLVVILILAAVAALIVAIRLMLALTRVANRRLRDASDGAALDR
jgi:hypothetical protein